MHRQLNHWKNAIERLSVLNLLISKEGWFGMEEQTRNRIHQALSVSVGKLRRDAQTLANQVEKQGNNSNKVALHKQIVNLRKKYLLAEETIHFYADAINTRTNSEMAMLLCGIDSLCQRSLKELLLPLQKQPPKVLTYVDKGLGASILKSDLRLWDGTLSPVAAIKVTQHNLPRPTAVIHETGHQAAAMLDWNKQLAKSLYHCLQPVNPLLAKILSSWSSEIAADAFAFVHTGYAAVASLHDVLAGEDELIYSFHQHDPHPISYIRILMNIEMCKRFYGKGAWNELESDFKELYPLQKASPDAAQMIKGIMPHLEVIVDTILRGKYQSFNGQALIKIINPEKVSPTNLQKLSNFYGNQLYTSPAIMQKESLRVLARTGYEIATTKQNPETIYDTQKQWMLALGKNYFSNT